MHCVCSGSAGEYAFNLHPDITTLGSAYLDLLESYAWKTITILYQDNDSLMTLKEIFSKTATVGPMDEFRLVVKQLAYNENGYRDVLKEIFQSESNLMRYMTHEQHPVTRAQYEQNLHDKQSDPVFSGDIAPLLNASVTYDPAKALQLVRDVLVTRIPGEPWRGETTKR